METLTQRQENFVRNVFEGMTQRAAYIDAYKPKYAIEVVDVNASRLLSKDKVRTRLQELNETAGDLSIATVIERKQVLTEILRGRFANFMTNLTKEKLESAALQEIRIIEYGKEVPIKTTTIKLHSPIQAIAELNKMERIYEEGSVTINKRTLVINVNSEKAKELLDEIAEGVSPHGPDSDPDI